MSVCIFLSGNIEMKAMKNILCHQFKCKCLL